MGFQKKVALSSGVVAQLVEVSCFTVQRVCQKGSILKCKVLKTKFWGCSSVGRASALQAEGRQFESDQLHQNKGKGDENPLFKKNMKYKFAKGGEFIMV